MERNGIKLTEQHVRWAALGGAILGGGGGGSAVTGAETGELAVRFSPLELTPLDQIDPETVIVTASMAWGSCGPGKVCFSRRYDALCGAVYQEHRNSARWHHH